MTVSPAHQPTTLAEALARRYPFAVVPEPTGGWDIVFPDLPGLSSHAPTLEQISENVRDALATWIEATWERNYPIPAPSGDWDPSPAWPTEPLSRLDGEPDPEPRPIYSTEYVADLLGLTTGRIRQLARERGLGRKVADVWMFTPPDVVALQDRPDRRGRPVRAVSSRETMDTPARPEPQDHLAVTGTHADH